MKTLRIGDIVQLQRGTTYKGALLGDTGPVLLGLATIKPHGGFRSDNFKRYSGDSPTKLILKPGDLYVSLKDVTQNTSLLGAVARVPEKIDQGRVTQDTVKLEFISADVSPTYLYWQLRTPQYRNYCRERATGTTTLGLAREDFLDYMIPAPNTEVNLLVDTLDQIEQKIELNSHINETLESMAKAIFKEWFIDFGPVKAKAEGKKPFGMDDEVASIFSDTFEDSMFGSIPKGWRPGKLEEIAEVIGGGTPSTAEASYYCEPSTGISWLSPKDLSGYSWKYISHGAADITESGLKNSSAKMLSAGTVLFSSRAPIGYVAIAEIDLCTNQGFKSLAPKNGSNTEFLYHFAKANVEFIEARASGSTFKEISGNGMKELPLIIPPNQILQAFRKVVLEFSKLQKELRHETNHLQKTRDLLLPKLIPGEVALDGAVNE